MVEAAVVVVVETVAVVVGAVAVVALVAPTVAAGAVLDVGAIADRSSVVEGIDVEIEVGTIEVGAAVATDAVVVVVARERLGASDT